MRILVTSGGTKVSIDPVRHIGNKSTGRFGAALAKEALSADCEVIYLISKDGKSPFSLYIDTFDNDNLEEELSKITELYDFATKFRKNYHEYRYQYFIEYAEMLQQLIQQCNPDVVVLAAAVSDYLVKDYSNEKIRSNKELSLPLEKAPKIINQIKKWAPDVVLVGFKLLIDGSDDELVEASLKVINDSHADIVVANNLTSLEQGAHEILIVEKTGNFKKIKEKLAWHVIQRILQG